MTDTLRPKRRFPAAVRRRGALLLLAALLGSTGGMAQSPPARPRDAVDARIDAAHAQAETLVARMTLAEKAGQIRHDAPAIPRLGIPAYNWWSEGLHGVARAGEATVFPQAIGMAATWDVPLIARTADTIATEFRAKYRASRAADGAVAQYRGLTVWSPNVNIFRDPRWGRGQETWGEDPYLTARFGVAFIRGLQGDDPAQLKTLAAVKHFAVHSGPEANRHRDDIHPSPYDLEDTYLPAFRAAVREGRTEGLMCAYNAVDGIPACALPMLQETVRDAWGFRGHIVSDCAAIADFFKPDAHRWVATPEQAAAAAIRAGTDLFCAEFGNDKSSDPAIIVRAVERGLLPVALLDRAVVRLMAARLRLGLIGPPVASRWSAIGTDAVDTPEHAALAEEVARASLVLLKNDGLLPLKAAPRRIAVIGPNADSIDALVGNYNGTPSRPVTVLAALRERFPQAQVDYVEGTGLTGTPFKAVPGAVLCADAACTMPGVRMEVFDGPATTGAPARSTTVADVRFGWGKPVRQERDGAVRWHGWLRPAATSRYRFQLSGFDGYRIRIDGQAVVSAWDAAKPEDIATRDIALTAGKPVPILVEARQKGSRGEQQLQWSGAEAREDAAIGVAARADLIVFAGGLTAKLEGEEMRVNAPGFAGGDRTSLDLPAPQQRLLEALHATGRPLVLVNMSGSAVALNWAERNVPAIVQAWYPGGTGARAIAGLIAGDFSPSGRLPVTFYRSADDLPPFDDYRMAGRTYRYFRGSPLYRFGHGLSFSRFAYAAPRLGARRIAPGGSTTLTVRVRNTGGRDAAEVVQLYATHRGGKALRALKGFERVMLKRGEARDVTFTLDPDALSQVDEGGRRAMRPGMIDLFVGGGQPGTQASGVSQSLTIAAR